MLSEDEVRKIRGVWVRQMYKCKVDEIRPFLVMIVMILDEILEMKKD